MSVVSNVIFKTALGDEDAVALLNKNFEPGVPFVSCDDEKLPDGWYGGTKYLECEIYPAAFNYLDKDELVKIIEAIKWEFPESVQLFIQEQEGDRLEEIHLNLKCNQ